MSKKNDSPMYEADRQQREIEELREPEFFWDKGFLALDRMDRWAGQVAAAIVGEGRSCPEENRVSQPDLAYLSYNIAEALERERTRRMKGPGGTA